MMVLRSLLRAALAILALVASASPAFAHVGSPDVYADGAAGPYKLSIVVRPPLVIPGVAEIEARVLATGIDSVAITPVPLVGEASKHPPVADLMQRSSKDPQFFTGQLWIMAPGSWQVRFEVKGGQGAATLSIPLPATAMGVRKMQPALGTILAVVGMILLLGMVGIIGAAAREAQLEPGETPPPARRRRSYVAMAVAFSLLVTGVVLGNRWWTAEASNYSGNVYRPLEMTATLQGDVLDLKMHDPGWLRQRLMSDFIPDHNHLMHLYMIRWPGMDVVFHLHPEQVGVGDFRMPLPSTPAGTYRLYADVVHASGFPETLVTTITLPILSGRQLVGDDAEGTSPALDLIFSQTEVPPSEAEPAEARDDTFKLPDGYTMVWKRPATSKAKAPVEFTFELLNDQGKPPQDMALYMGMQGHAAFVKTDGTVFAHIHPSGTVSMAALMMANPQAGTAQNSTPDMKGMPGMEMSSGYLPNTVSFPYGFPTAGRYRIFVQMKHGNTVETGTFDAEASEPGK